MKDMEDLSNWMRDLPEKSKAKPLSQLCLPGSHDSFTYSLERGSGAGPDQPECIRALTRIFPNISSHLLMRWSRTQEAVLTKQLQGGFRYFDIRLEAVGEKEDREWRVLHCLMGAKIRELLQEIRSFLDNHCGEVVILDIQHTYSFLQADHAALASFLLSTFQHLLVPYEETKTKVPSLATLQKRNTRVVVIYPPLAPCCPLLWPRKGCPTPWPDTTDTSKLRRCLGEGLSKRDPDHLFVSQGVLTPTVTTVLFHPFSGLRDSCGKRANKCVRDWLKKGAQPNILITDFVLEDAVSGEILNLLIDKNRG